MPVALHHANKKWVSSKAFAGGRLVDVTRAMCAYWIDVLRPQLALIHSQGPDVHDETEAVKEPFQICLDMFEEVLKKAIYRTLSIAAQLRLAGHDVVYYPPSTEFEGQTMESIHEEHGGRFLWTMLPGIQKSVDGRPEIICKATVICEVPAPQGRPTGYRDTAED